MNEADLEDALFPRAADRSKGKIIPDWSYIHQELKKKGGNAPSSLAGVLSTTSCLFL